MRKIISCAVFKPYIEHIEKSMLKQFHVTYLDVKQHNQPTLLAKAIQKEIDQNDGVDEIVLLYGLCGNAILPLKVRSGKITILRVHDCLSVLLGSKERFVSLFSHRLSQGWSCLAYAQNEDTSFNTSSQEYQHYIEEYGEDNAMYIMQQMHPESPNPPIYIDFNLAEDEARIASYEQPVEIIKGDFSYLRKVLLEQYDDDVVEMYKNECIKTTYDFDTVFYTEKIETDK